jgi:putative Ca2+/H+ antiporter (TMEM165/GDT1 family)
MGAVLVAAAVVFVAELGDKTQLLAMSLATRFRPLPVLAGIGVAYGATNLLSVAVGGTLGAVLPTEAIRVGGGLLFLLFAWLAWRDGDEDGEDGEAVPEVRAGHIVRSVAAAMFVAELGDKTMLSTATLAAQDNAVLVWIGATIGILACGGLAVLAGRLLGERLSRRTTRLLSVVLFAAFGVLLLVDGLVSL